MSDACYTARVNTAEQVRLNIEKLTLHKNSNGQYNHDDAITFKAGLERVLTSTFNIRGGGKGMVALLTKDSALSLIKSTDAETASTVLTEARKEAVQRSKEEDATVTPAFTTRADAQEEADRRNQINQAVIGAKEGATEAITAKVGKDITDSILRTADGKDVKGIDDYQLYELIDAIIQGADRPATMDILDQLVTTLSTPFDFQRKIIHNYEVLKSHASRMATYGESPQKLSTKTMKLQM